MKTEQGPPLQNTNTTPSQPTLDIDVMDFAAHLEGAGLDADQMREMLQIYWQIVVSFVDLGFGIHPAQMACGKLLDIAAEGADPPQDVIKSEASQTPQTPPAERAAP